jgi:hypothetical protein
METTSNTIKQVDKIVRDFEAQQTKRPTNMFLWTSVGALSVALILKLSRKKNMSAFISQWATPLLLYFICNKLVKEVGKTEKEQVLLTS